MEKLLKNIKSFANSIKTLYALYVLMYIVPQLLPFSLSYAFWNNLIVNEKNINYPVLISVSICGMIIIGWNLFFLLYLTKERTQHPQLYGRHFFTGFDMTTDTDSKAETFRNPKEIKDDVTSSNPTE